MWNEKVKHPSGVYASADNTGAILRFDTPKDLNVFVTHVLQYPMGKTTRSGLIINRVTLDEFDIERMRVDPCFGGWLSDTCPMFLELEGYIADEYGVNPADAFIVDEFKGITMCTSGGVVTHLTAAYRGIGYFLVAGVLRTPCSLDTLIPAEEMSVT
jgi:hypothetical protein